MGKAGVEPRTPEEDYMQKFQILMLEFGYRSPVKEDLLVGKEFYMLEVDRLMQVHNQSMNPKFLADIIKLDNEPIRPSCIEPGQEMVYYHCIVPAWDQQCFVSIDDFTATGYRDDGYANHTRYFVKVNI